MLGTRFPNLSVGLIAVFFSVATVAGQTAANRDTDALDQFRRRAEVAAQKVEADIRRTLSEAQRLTASDPAKALDRLNKLLTQLEDDATLAEKRREALKRLVKDRIQVTKADADNPAAPLEKQAQAAKRRAEQKEQAAEQGTLQRLLGGIQKLQKEGKLAEARSQAADAASRYPNNPVAQAANRTSSLNEQLSDLRQLQTERDRRSTGVLRDVDKTALAPKGDMEFPKDWKQRTKNRTSTTVKMTVKERTILRTLDSEISVRFKDTPLEDVIEYLQTVKGLPIIVDRAALEEAGVTYDTPITLQAKGWTVRTLLRKVLNDIGLTYIIRDEVVKVVSPQAARESMVTRVYPIGDLVTPLDARFLGTGLARLRMLQNVAQLIDLIQTTVDPQSWKANGGTATISFNEQTKSLVIKQGAEFQSVLESALR
jgi:hypothetical protein